LGAGLTGEASRDLPVFSGSPVLQSSPSQVETESSSLGDGRHMKKRQT